MFFLFLTLGAFAQNLSRYDQRLIVLGVVDRFFESLRSYDSVILREVMLPNALIKHVDAKSSTGFTAFTVNDFSKMLSRAKAENWIEIPFSYDLLLEDHMAVAWVGYNDIMAGKLVRCGMNQIELILTDKGWKISEVVDTQNPENCSPQDEIKLVSMEQLRFDQPSIHRFIDQWHIAAAQADFKAYFGVLDSLSIYMGTDATERWSKEKFIKFAKPYFDKGKAWEFHATQRNLSFDKAGKLVWFDELLSTSMGTCRGSGVLEFTGNTWKIRQYNLSLMVPNDKLKAVMETIGK